VGIILGVDYDRIEWIARVDVGSPNTIRVLHSCLDRNYARGNKTHQQLELRNVREEFVSDSVVNSFVTLHDFGVYTGNQIARGFIPSVFDLLLELESGPIEKRGDIDERDSVVDEREEFRCFLFRGKQTVY